MQPRMTIAATMMIITNHKYLPPNPPISTGIATARFAVCRNPVIGNVRPHKMSPGDGIFLSSVLLSVIALFAITKDRWNWKRISKWGTIGPIALAVVLGGGAYLYSRWVDRPTPQSKFGDIELTATPADVLFAKGEPQLRDSPDRWVYNAGSGSAAPNAAKYLVMFKDSRVRFVLYSASETQIVSPWFMGFDIGTSHERIVEKLGQPTNVSISENQLDRMFSYDRYNAFFSFSQGKLVAYGIYQPNTGPMAFRKELAASSPAQ